jgi:ABC-type transporter Mla subunit MlaD
MNGRSRVGSLAASPTMVGAITTLIIIVAVFLAYNANNGLPFVPVYRVSAEICNAARIGPNNEVRIGGNRVGVVESIETVDLDQASGCQTAGGESAAAAARLNLKLEQEAKPLPEDSTIRVRYRSSFGLKYLELARGEGEGLPEGGTLPLEQAQVQTEFDDIGNTFDTATRESSRRVLQGFGDGFAARGASLNQAIEALNPLFANLRPVSAALADPTTVLERFFPELADAARIVAPVAEDQAQLFTHGAIAFGAISSDPEALRDSISNGVATLETGVRTLPRIEPFIRDFAEVSRLLRPGVRDLRISLPILNGALAAGAKVLPKTVQTSDDLQQVFVKLEALADQPSTKVSINRLGDLFTSTDSAASKIAPYETVCHYWEFWSNNISEHFAQAHATGTAERVILTGAPGLATPNEWPMNPIDNYSAGQSNGRNSVASLADPGKFLARTQVIAHGNPYGPSGTQDAPNCQGGQTGYALGEALVPGQEFSNPAFGVANIAAAAGVPPLGQSNVFIQQNGQREFADR